MSVTDQQTYVASPWGALTSSAELGLAGVIRRAVGSYTRARDRAEQFEGRSKATIAPLSCKSTAVDEAVEGLRIASERLSSAVQALEAEVAHSEWSRQPENHVLVARNIARGKGHGDAPGSPITVTSRRTLVSNVRGAADHLDAMYSLYWRALDLADGADRRYVLLFLRGESQARESDGVRLLRADMTISARRAPTDAAESQGVAASALVHWWRHDDGTVWHGAHTLVSYCQAALFQLASTDGQNEIRQGLQQRLTRQARSALEVLRVSGAVVPCVDTVDRW